MLSITRRRFLEKSGSVAAAACAVPAAATFAIEPRRCSTNRRLHPVAFSRSSTMKMTLSTYELKTRHPFTISRGTTVTQRTLVVELEQDGFRGYGESCHSSFFGATIENMTAALEGVRPRIEGRELDDPATLWKELDPIRSKNRFAQSALDQAAWDLRGKLRGLPVWRMWGLSIDHCPPTDYTIGIDPIEKMVAKLKEMPGFLVYKVKLGTRNDLAIMQALRKVTDVLCRKRGTSYGWYAYVFV